MQIYNVPLEWVWEDNQDCYVANAQFGNYWLKPDFCGKQLFSYRYGDNRWETFNSLEKAKAAAQAHWNERVSPIIQAYLDGVK